jgi:hypothetical protein
MAGHTRLIVCRDCQLWNGKEADLIQGYAIAQKCTEIGAEILVKTKNIINSTS